MVEEKLKDLNLIIPDAPKPVGSYVAYKIVDKIVYISGQLPIKDGEIIKGKVGDNVSLLEAQKASYQCCVNIIAQLKLACDGNLNKVKNCIKITGFVNSDKNFIDQAKVINTASELLVNIFGERGKHARAAVSANSLPLGAAVEIDSIFEVI
jgi:enamine deaminase RidA (YjgF/YER057c/UK114 family)